MVSYEDEDCFEFEYSEESTSESDVDLENQYYFAKTFKDHDLHECVFAFEKVLELQGNTRGEWGFKSLKYLVMINFELKNYLDALRWYKELLKYIPNSVTKNYGEITINLILDFISSCKEMIMLQKFYETTLDALKTSKNQRLWVKTNLKLGKVLLEKGDFSKLAEIIRQLKQTCQVEINNELEPYNGTQLLEIYALEIQMYTAQMNDKELKNSYEKSLRIQSAIAHPLTMSLIRECGGKMHLRTEEYEKAYTDFFEAFKNYDETGNPRRIFCLNYLLLTSMLMNSSINPLDSQEAKPYKKNAEVKVMIDLISAFQNNNKKLFESLFDKNKDFLMQDQFLHDHVVKLLMHIKTNVLLDLIKPYKNIRISFIGEELGVCKDEVITLLESCILNKLILGRIDEMNGTLVMTSDECIAKYLAMEDLARQIDRISNGILQEYF